MATCRSCGGAAPQYDLLAAPEHFCGGQARWTWQRAQAPKVGDQRRPVAKRDHCDGLVVSDDDAALDEVRPMARSDRGSRPRNTWPVRISAARGIARDQEH